MKKVVCLIFIAMLACQSGIVQAQLAQKLYNESRSKGSDAKNPFDQKFRWGVAFNSYWSSFKGSNLERDYFFKPSIGGSVRAEYYFKPFIGLAAGVGFQQGGAGIINVDKTGGAFAHPWIIDKNGNRGDVDSTHLERMRFSSIEIPVSLIFRTPKGKSDFRFSGGAGVVFVNNFQQNDAWLDVVGGMHNYTFVSDYRKNDLAYQLSLGTDINAGDQGSILQIHFIYQRGTQNVYAKGQGQGNEVRCGLRFSWLF